jgi:hypothetical protein
MARPNGTGLPANSRIMFHLTLPDLAALRGLAQEEQIPLSAIVRRIVRAHLAKRKNKAA